jgi:hypothetical protein
VPDPNRIGPLDKPRKFSRALFDRVVQKLIHSDQNTLDAIRSCGISTSLFYKELQSRPELAAVFKEAQVRRDSVRNTKRIEEAERELHRRAVDGWDEPVFDIKGNHCGNKRRYSDACLIFMLKKLKPEVFEDRPAALVQNNVAIATGDEKEILSRWREKLGAAPE